MINITYAADQKVLAEQIRDDLAEYQSAHQVLLVLVSADSNNDPSVQAEIKRAVDRQIVSIIPILAENVALPELLDRYKSLNFSGGYKRNVLMTRLSQTTMTDKDVKKANRLAFVFIGGIALVMFVVGILGIVGGVVAFPVDEYNEEATYQAEWINGLIVETLEAAQPHTTQDAVNFESTLEAVPTRVYLYIRETATAMPNVQGD